MTPGGPYFMPPEEQIRRIQADDAAWHRLGDAISNFLIYAFPYVARGVCGEVGDALSALMVLGSDEQIDSIKNPPKPPIFEPPRYPVSVEMLARLIDERDRMQSRLEEVEKGMETLRSSPVGALSGMADIMSGSIAAPVRQALDQINEEISKMQKRLEGQES